MTKPIFVEPLSPFNDPTLLELSSNLSVPEGSKYTIRATSTTSDWILTVPTGKTHRIQNSGANAFRVAYQPSGVHNLTPGSEIEVSWSAAGNNHVVQVVASTEYDDVITALSTNAPKTSAVKTYVDTQVVSASGTPIVDNLAAIRAYSTAPEWIIARGHTAPLDGGGSRFCRVVASGSLVGDDDGWHVRHTATGALYARDSAIVTPEMFGAFRSTTVAAAAAAADQKTRFQEFVDFCFRRGDFTGWTHHAADPQPRPDVPVGYYRCNEPIRIVMDNKSNWVDGVSPPDFIMRGAVFTPNTVKTEGFIVDMHRNEQKPQMRLRAVKQRAGGGKVVWDGDPWPDLYRDPAAYPSWPASTQVFVDDEIVHTIGSGETVLYQVTAAGVTGASGPSHTTGSAANGGATLLARGTIRNTLGQSCHDMLARCRDIGVSIVRSWEQSAELHIETLGYTVGVSLLPRSVSGAVGWCRISAPQQIGCKIGVVVGPYLFDQEVANQAARLALTGLPISYKVRQTDDATNDWVFNGPLAGEATAGNWSSIARDTSARWCNENWIETGLIYGRGDGTMITTTKSVYGAVVTGINTGITHGTANILDRINAERNDETGNAETVQVLFYAGAETRATGRNDAPSHNRAAVFCRRLAWADEPRRNEIRVARAGNYFAPREWRLEENCGQLNIIREAPGHFQDRTKRFEVPSLLEDAIFSGSGTGSRIYWRKSGVWHPTANAARQHNIAGLTSSQCEFNVANLSFDFPFQESPCVIVELPDNHTGDAILEIELMFADSTGSGRPVIRIFNPVTGVIGEQHSRPRTPVIGQPGQMFQSSSGGKYYYQSGSSSQLPYYISFEPWIKKAAVTFYGDGITGYRMALHHARAGRLYAAGKDKIKPPGPVVLAKPEWGVWQAPTRLWYIDQTGVDKGVYLNKSSADVDYWATSGNTAGIGSPTTYQWGHNGAGTVRIYNGTTWDDVISGVQTLDPADWVAF